MEYLLCSAGCAIYIRWWWWYTYGRGQGTEFSLLHFMDACEVLHRVCVTSTSTLRSWLRAKSFVRGGVCVCVDRVVIKNGWHCQYQLSFYRVHTPLHQLSKKHTHTYFKNIHFFVNDGCTQKNARVWYKNTEGYHYLVKKATTIGMRTYRRRAQNKMWEKKGVGPIKKCYSISIYIYLSREL